MLENGSPIKIGNPLQQLMTRVRKHIPRTLIVDYNGDYRRSVFIAGTGRSGTTWLADVLNYDRAYRDVFEPFNGYFVRQSRRFYYPLYLRPDNCSRRYLAPARRILSGRIRGWWVDQNNRRCFVQRRLIKEVRANLWLKWLKVHFPELPIILLFRHPCAVAESRMMLEWPTRLQEFLTQHELMQDHLLQFRDAMLGARTALERHILVWCIQYYVPLRQFARGEIHLTFYEHLVARPQEELPRLFRYLCKEFDDRVYAALDAPSFVTNTESVIHTDRSGIVDSWTRRMSREDVAKSISILRLFGLDKIYGEDPFADIAAANEVLRGSLGPPQRA